MNTIKGNLKRITSEDEYQETLQQVWKLIDADPDTIDEEELVVLAGQVDIYEQEHYPIGEEEEENARRRAREELHKELVIRGIVIGAIWTVVAYFIYWLIGILSK